MIYTNRETLESYKVIADIKWAGGYVCPNCGCQSYIKGKAPYSRRCADCKKDSSPTANTILHGLRFPLHIALYILKEIALSTERIKSVELKETIELKQKTRIRQKTIWDFLIKVYNAIPGETPVYTGPISIIRYSNRDITVIAAKGITSQRTMYVAKSGLQLNEFIEIYVSKKLQCSAYDVSYKYKVGTSKSNRQRVLQTEMKPITINRKTCNIKDETLNNFAQDIYNCLAGVNATHHQAYLNLFCFKANRRNYNDLLKTLVNNSNSI